MSSALLVVDVQRDFCSGGALAVPDGDAVVPVCNGYVARAEAAGLALYASRDWHPPDTAHFVTHGGMWPPHCIQNSPGAEFHPELRLPPSIRIVSKGTGKVEDGYSMMSAMDESGTPLTDLLRKMGVERLYVGGLATDYCVRATVLDALQAGFAVSVLTDACRAVNLDPADGPRALAEMERAGARAETLETFLL